MSAQFQSKDEVQTEFKGSSHPTIECFSIQHLNPDAYLPIGVKPPIGPLDRGLLNGQNGLSLMVHFDRDYCYENAGTGEANEIINRIKKVIQENPRTRGKVSVVNPRCQTDPDASIYLIGDVPLALEILTKQGTDMDAKLQRQITSSYNALLARTKS